MRDYVGQQFGNYYLLRLLGVGNSAAVYLGEHQYLEIPAAIKILHVRMEPEKYEAFRREAHTIARMLHPNIVRVLDFGFHEQIPYLVMEYSPNGTLRTRYPSGTRLPIEQIVCYVQQTAAALDYAHAQHVIHRDVKPDNLLLNAQGEIALSDFGIAVVQHTLASLANHDIAGTPLYMAPEQIRHHPGPASDQYALAAVVYEWFCGEPPFRGFLFEVLNNHLHHDPPSLCARVPDLHPAIEKVIFKALAKEPERRFATVGEFASALAQVSATTQILPMHPAHEQGPAVVLSAPALSPRAGSGNARVMEQAPQVEMHNAAVSLQVRPAVAQRNRQVLLGKVRSFWIEGRLNHSLHGATLLTLGLHLQPDVVANPWNLALQYANATSSPLPAGTSITQIYDAATGELLILGAPGAGKTTLLLELARDLLVRAERDEQHPMPVIFNLSTWASKRQPVVDWLAEELASKYLVPFKLAIVLVKSDQILPLLDGLDEMEPAARTACIDALNTYRRDHGLLPLVISCRLTDYLAQSGRLLVYSAVTVQPLTQEQIDVYLAQGGAALRALRVALYHDEELRNLASTPLMLSILSLTYHNKTVEQLLRDLSPQGRQRQVFEQYVKQMLTRRGSLKPGTTGQMIHRLTFLAARMRERNQTVFYLEHLQPDWLPARERRAYTWLGVLLPGVLIGILTSIGVSTFFKALSTPIFLIILALLGGFLGGLFSESMPEQVSFHDRGGVKFGWRQRLHFIRQVALSLLIGLLAALSFGLYLGKQFSIGDWLLYGGIEWVVIGLECLLLQLLCLSSKLRRGLSQKRRAQWWRQLIQTVHGQRTLRVVFVIGSVSGLSNGLFVGLHYGLLYGINTGLFSGLDYGQLYGMVSVLVSLVLTTQGRDVVLAERLRWTWGSLMNGLLVSRHRNITMSVTGIITAIVIVLDALGVVSYLSKYGLITSLLIVLSEGLGTGLIFGLSYWVVFGLLRGVSSEQIEEQARLVPGQGVKWSLRSSLLMGSITCGVVFLVNVLTYGLGNVLYFTLFYGIGGEFNTSLRAYTLAPTLLIGLNEGLRSGLLSGWVLGLCGGLLVCAMSGGIAVWRHNILCLLLRRAGAFPPHEVHFLDEAVDCLLLQKVGGGYTFVHRLLLDYFASLERRARS